MTAVEPGTRCECIGECDRVQAFGPGYKGHRYPGRCENRHTKVTPFDRPKKIAVLDVIENRENGVLETVCQWCSPVFRDPSLYKPEPRRRGR